MSRLQFISLFIFGAIAIVAILMFGGVIPGFQGEKIGKKGERVILWGTFDKSLIRSVIQDLNDENQELFKIVYVEKNPDTFDEEVIDALAAGEGPDMWIITQDKIFKNKDKVFIIPYEFFRERDFKDNFIDSAEIYLTPSGIVGVPLVVDPIVLYWNRDLFSSSGISTPPSTWNEFLADVQSLTRKSETGNILQAGTALGEFVNVRNAKDILSMMVLQTGNKMVDPDQLRVVFDEKIGGTAISPMESVVIFYNQFSNPRKESYSWNRSLMNSDDMFISGSLAMYFGFASEYPLITKRNPHLNFDVALVPQIKDGPIKATFGKIYAIVVSKSSQKKQSVLYAISRLTSDETSSRFAEAISMAPARRKALSRGHQNAVYDVFYKSAVMSRNWLEPDPEKVFSIFKDLIESTNTGKLEVSRAVSDAANLIEILLREK